MSSRLFLHAVCKSSSFSLIYTCSLTILSDAPMACCCEKRGIIVPSHISECSSIKFSLSCFKNSSSPETLFILYWVLLGWINFLHNNPYVSVFWICDQRVDSYTTGLWCVPTEIFYSIHKTLLITQSFSHCWILFAWFQDSVSHSAMTCRLEMAKRLGEYEGRRVDSIPLFWYTA